MKFGISIVNSPSIEAASTTNKRLKIPTIHG